MTRSILSRLCRRLVRALLHAAPAPPAYPRGGRRRACAQEALNASRHATWHEPLEIGLIPLTKVCRNRERST
jgi:hypothetical protein